MEHETPTPMTPAEVARLADPPATPASVRAWERDGKLRATRTASGMRLFDRGDVETFLANRRATIAALKATRGGR